MKKTTEDFAEELYNTHDLILTSEYEGAHSTVTFLCKNNHENKAIATNLLRRGYNCKECKTGYKVEPKVIWTDEKLKYINDNRTKSVEELAEALNTTVGAVTNACQDHKVQRPKIDKTLPIFLEALEQQRRTLVSEYKGLATKVRTKCSNGHVTEQIPNNIIRAGSICQLCPKTTSKAELEIRAFIEENYDGWIVYNDRNVLAPRELDIVLPDLSLAIEYNGNYWHQEAKVGKTYHLDKTNQAEAQCYQLLHISEANWLNKRDIVKHRLLSKLNKLEKIGARQTKLVQLSWPDTKVFLEKYHLQGAGSPTKYNLALKYNDETVAVMTFSKPRFTKNYDLELVRFATSYTVLGGASKLFKARPAGTIVTYADRAFSTGKLYETLGFKLLHTSKPNYKYYRRDIEVTRYQAQKHKLKDLLEEFDETKTEKENMANNSYYPVYDSGNLVYGTISF